MNNERRRINELNTLSAYLDNALNKEEAERLEARLEKESELREKLENLKRTKILLNRLDRVPAPRNYTLTPDMVKVRGQKNKPLFMTLRLASSFAAILLVVLFGVQFALQGGILPPKMQSEAPMLEAARVEDEMTPEPLIFWAEPGTDGGVEGYGGGPSEDMIEAPNIPEEPVEGEEKAPAEEPAAPEEQPEIESLPSIQDYEDSSPILGVNPEESGKILDRSEPGVAEEEITPDWSKIIQWIQIALAVIAVGSGVTLLLLRRKTRQ
jgi:hypothetical protein